MREIKLKGAKEPTIALALDTIEQRKQALVFCASKRAAESQAEKIAKSISTTDAIDFRGAHQLAQTALHTLSTPTKQCKRLARCLEKGIAFHHAGLASPQRELIEEQFRSGAIKIICSTPTLAAGLDLPAFRAVIRDTKRFGTYGMVDIPVLEYEQMAGRAGRPGKEEYGEALLVANTTSDLPDYFANYVHGEVEDIYSKLAVETVLRTYILSLIATGFIKTGGELQKFFAKTFYAQQFGNLDKLNATLHRITSMLVAWEFLEGAGGQQRKKTNELFMTGTQLLTQTAQQAAGKLTATNLGGRVSEIYLDPLTARTLLDGLKQMHEDKKEAHDRDQTFALTHLLCCALEMRPLLRVKTKEYDDMLLYKEQARFLLDEEAYMDKFSDDFEDTIKTARCLMNWMEEYNEETLLERYDVRPGELSMKQQKADWLLYACEEIARVENLKGIRSILKHVRTRMKHGAKSELLTLLHFQGIGRVRARKLYTRGIRGVSDVKQASYEQLTSIVGQAMAGKLKEQVGEKVNPPAQKPTPPSKRPQRQLGSFT